jgi:hypothetical protein
VPDREPRGGRHDQRSPRRVPRARTEPGIVKTFRRDGTEPGTYGDQYASRPLGPDRTVLTLTSGWNGLDMTDERAALKAGWSTWIDMLEDAFGTRTG